MEVFGMCKKLCSELEQSMSCFLSKGTTQTVNFLSQFLSDKHRPLILILPLYQPDVYVKDEWLWEEKTPKVKISFSLFTKNKGFRSFV